ncbi:MAG: CBS domain-containing protein [Candidatus Methylomirabilales bacterium]
MKVRDIMRRPAGLISPEATIGEALAQMQALKLASLPVVDRNSALLGVVSAEALSRVPEAERSGSLKPHVSAFAATANPEMDAGRLAEMLRYKGLDATLVLEARHLVGSLTLAEAEAATQKR